MLHQLDPLAGEAEETSGAWIVNDDDAQQVSRHSRHLDQCRRRSALALKPVLDSVERASAYRKRFLQRGGHTPA
jgi:hypothetical protein